MQRSPLKVLLLQDTTNYAGTEAHVLTLAKNLEEHTDVSPIVGVTAGGELEMRCAAGNIPYRVLPKTPGMFNLAGITAVAKMLRNRDIDVVHAHNGRTSLVAVCAKIIARKGRIVLTQHFIEPDYVNRRGLAGKLAGMIHRFILKNVDQHICISEAVKSTFLGRQEQAVVDRECVHIVNNGVDDVYSKLDRDSCREQILSYLNLPAFTKLILCVSRLEPEKDVQALLASLTNVDNALPYHCVIVGDGSERTQMEAFVREVKIDERVSFMGYRADVPNIMKSSDLFVLPCPAEGFGLVIAEAMFAGLPVVAINHGGPVEIVISEETGLLVPRNNIMSMSTALKTLLENTSQSLAMGLKGKERAQTVYASSVMAIKTGNVYAACGLEGQ
jgi:glycosyltransferase involved in cell wall biosynthesis